jgi:proline dehydrogenase
VLRRALLSASDSDQVRRIVSRTPVSRGVVRRFVAGEDADAALAATRQLVAHRLRVSVDRLGEATLDREHAATTTTAHIELFGRIADAGLAEFTEVSLKLSSIGQAIDDPDAENLALDNARLICAAAQQAGSAVTIDMEDHTTTDSTLSIVSRLRIDYPTVGAVLQAYLRRTAADCKDLAVSGSRIRLCKGAYKEPASVAFQDKAEVDLSYVRCARILLHGKGYPMIATHDPRLVAVSAAMALQAGRVAGDHEYQMLYGIRPDEQQRLASRGETVRVYVPYGTQWYPYLVRRLAERPANVAFFLRALKSRR